MCSIDQKTILLQFFTTFSNVSAKVSQSNIALINLFLIT